MDAYRDIPAFKRWCASHHIEIDERLEITVSSDNGVSIHTKPNVNIAIGESVVRIPKAMVFSTSNCSKARELAPWLSRAEPALELALALITEVQLGPCSPWHTYFLFLPKDTVDIGVFWHLHGNQEGLEARQWLQGTEAEKILSHPKGTLKLLERIDTYFETVAKPVLQSEFGVTTYLPEFHRAYSIVSSRAFLVDAHLGLSLVPVADLFNHTENNHVHLEADYHVCPTCGSLQECGHDSEDLADWESTGPTESRSAIDDTCEMVTDLPIGGNEEVFNTYEDGLANAHLLCHYGFMLDGNENDLITWTMDELLLQISEKDAAKRHRETALLSSHWKFLSSRLINHWSGSQMVYNPLSYAQRKSQGTDEHGSGIGIEDAGPGDSGLLNPASGCLNLNADGQVSLQLWVALFLIALADVKGKVDAEAGDVIESMEIITERQEYFEAELMAAQGGGEDSWSAVDPGPSLQINKGDRITEHRALEAIAKDVDINETSIVQRIADLVVDICGQKLQSVHLPELSEQQIGEMLDELPETGSRLVRLGMKYALEIRRILRSCQSAWMEFTGEFILMADKRVSIDFLAVGRKGLRGHIDI